MRRTTTRICPPVKKEKIEMIPKKLTKPKGKGQDEAEFKGREAGKLVIALMQMNKPVENELDIYNSVDVIKIVK